MDFTGPKNTRQSLRISESMQKALKEFAEKNNMTVSQVIEQAINFYLNEGYYKSIEKEIYQKIQEKNKVQYNGLQ